MDALHAAQSSSRPHLDGERRRPLSLAAHRHTGLPAHDWDCSRVALHQCPRLPHHRHFLHLHALRHRAVAAARSHFPVGSLAGVEHLGALRNISLACGAERVLWLQCLAADCVFHGRFCLRPFRYRHWHRHVASGGEPPPLVCADFWRPAIGPVYSLPYYAQFLSISRGARHADRDDRLCTQHESHRAGDRRSRALGYVLGICGHRRGRAFVGWWLTTSPGTTREVCSTPSSP